MSKQFYFSNQITDVRRFNPLSLKLDLSNACISALFPTNLAEVFVTDFKYNLFPNVETKLGKLLYFASNVNPLGVFRNQIIKEYNVKPQTLFRDCPYCKGTFMFSLKGDCYEVSSFSDRFWPLVVIDFNFSGVLCCQKCCKNVQVRRSGELILVEKVESFDTYIREKERFKFLDSLMAG